MNQKLFSKWGVTIMFGAEATAWRQRGTCCFSCLFFLKITHDLCDECCVCNRPWVKEMF